jgi:GntR family transcriptional regulator / MocR family aminotransferase
MDLELDGQGALYEQIARALKRAILEGRLISGSRLPSTRALAHALSVSRKSIIEAYELLCVEQLAVARGGSGTRVANLRTAPARHRGARSHPTSRYAARIRTLGPVTLASRTQGPVTLASRTQQRYDLHMGEPLINPSLFASWRRKLAAAALRAGPRYPAPEGFMPLRVALAEYLGRRRGVICEPSDILVVGGTQQALTIISRVLLDAGRAVVIEDPFYQMAAFGLMAHGARLIHVRTDEQGLVTGQLPKRRARMAYVTPSHQFPSGAIMSLERRMQLLHWASSNGCWIFEDDYDAEFHSGTRPVPALRTLDLADRVIYVGSFSKTLFPSLRLGYIVCPKSLRDDLFRAKLLDDNGSPTIEQAALATFIESRQYEKHLRRSVKELIDRRCAAVDALNRLLGSQIDIGPHEGGMHFVVWLRQLTYERFATLLDRASAAGLGLYPVHHYYRTRPPQPGVLLGYAGLSSGQIKTAIEIFAQCLKAL